jgi:predicted ester cyclase
MGTIMTVEANKALITSFVEEVLQQGNVEAIPNYFRPNTFWAGTIQQLLTYQRAAFPDLQWTIDSMVAEGDQVVAKLSYSGTNTGPVFFQPPTGKQVQIQQVWFFKIKEGKIASGDLIRDRLMLFEQLGIAPPAPQPSE